MRTITQAAIWSCYQDGVEKKIFVRSREDLYGLSREALLTAVALGIDARIIDHNRYDEHAHNNRGRDVLTTDLEEVVIKLGRGRIRIALYTSGCVGKRAKLMLVDDCIANRDYADECIKEAQDKINRETQFEKEYYCVWDVSLDVPDDNQDDDRMDSTIDVDDLMRVIEGQNLNNK